MSLPSSVGVRVAVGLGIPAIVGVLYVLVTLIGFKESRADVELANGFRIIFATKGEIKKAAPDAFAGDSADNFSDHRGWFYPQSKVAIVYTLHSERFTPERMSTVPVICEKACLGTLTDADLVVLDPEVRAVVGVLFHELIGHGSDAYASGHLFTMMHMLWPEIIIPAPEPVQNPWKIVRRYWPLHATHPTLEERTYDAPAKVP